MTKKEALRFLSEVHNVEPDMPLKQIMCLLIVAEEEEGMSLTDIAKKANTNLASASRYVSALGKVNRYRTEGLNLLESYEDPMERRKKIIRLTTKGKSAVKQLLGEKNANLRKRESVCSVCGKHTYTLSSDLQDQS